MKYRRLPGSDIDLSAVGFGMWTVATTWWGEFSDDEAITLMKQAKDLGVNFFGAADAYGNGRSETLLAKAFKNQRDEIVIGTKFAYDIYTNPEARTGHQELPQQASPQYVRHALEQSLLRLETDYVDLYQIHNAKMEHIVDDSLFETLEALKKEGKIRHYGVALGPAIGWLAEGVLAIRERNVDAVMIIHNMLEQHPGNTLVQEAIKSKQTGLLVRVPHASGMLEGHYTLDTTFPKGDHRAHRPKSWLVNGVKKVEQLRFLEKPNRTLGQAAIQYLLADDAVTSVMPNIYNAEQVTEFATACETPALTPDELAQIQALVANNFGITDEPPMMYKGTMDYPENNIEYYRQQLLAEQQQQQLQTV